MIIRLIKNDIRRPNRGLIETIRLKSLRRHILSILMISKRINLDLCDSIWFPFLGIYSNALHSFQCWTIQMKYTATETRSQSSVRHSLNALNRLRFLQSSSKQNHLRICAFLIHRCSAHCLWLTTMRRVNRSRCNINDVAGLICDAANVNLHKKSSHLLNCSRNETDFNTIRRNLLSFR